MRHLVGAKGAQGGADAFIPILIFVVLKANPEHLISNVECVLFFDSTNLRRRTLTLIDPVALTSAGTSIDSGVLRSFSPKLGTIFLLS